MRKILLIGLLITAFIAALWPDIELTLDIPAPQFLDNRQVSELPVIQRPGDPMLPYQPLRILLPQGERFVDIEVSIEESGKRIVGLDLPISTSQAPISWSKEVKTQTEQEISWQGMYPAERFRVHSQERKMGYEILIVNLYPYQYNTESGVLRISDRYHLKIKTIYDRTLAEEQNRMLLTTRPAREEIARLVENPEMVYRYNKINIQRNSLLPDQSDSHSMIVITDSQRSEYFTDFIDWKNDNGLSTTLFLVEDIYLAYDGIDDQEQIRNFIIDAYETYSLTETPLEYVLLGGDDTIVPVRGFYCLVNGLWTIYEDHNIPTDVYYSNLDGNWDANGNGIYGDPDDGIDWFAEIAIGRVPGVSENDFLNFFQKNYHYAASPAYSNDIAIMIGQNLDNITWGGDYKDEIIPILPDQYRVSRFYEKDGSYNNSAIRESINNGLGILNHLGHSNESTVFGLTGSSVSYLTNSEFGLAYSQGCYTAAFDSWTTPDSYCIGQRLVNAEGAFFAFIGNTRYGWYWPGSTEGASQLFDITFFKGLFEEDIRFVGKTLNYSKETLVNEAIENDFQHHLWKNGFMRWTFYNQILFGDPSAYIRSATGLFPYLEPVDVVYDDSMGDNDGIANPGETVNLYIELYNQENWAGADNISVEITGNYDGINLIKSTANYPPVSAGSTTLNSEPFIISLSNDIPYGDYDFNISIVATGNEENEFFKEYDLSIPISLRQQHWPWESVIPVQAAPLINEHESQLAQIIAINALSNISFLNYRAEEYLPSLSFDTNMLKSAAMGDLLNNGKLIVVLVNRSGLIIGVNLEGEQIFSYNSGSQFINTPVLADISGNEELEVLVFGIDRRLFALTSSGEPLHGFPLQLENNVLVELAAADISKNGAAEIIIGYVTGDLDVIDLTGESINGFPINLGAAINTSPIILDDNSIVVSTQTNSLYKITHEGKIEWVIESDSRIISETIAADFTGNNALEIAFVTNSGEVSIVNRSGELLTGFPLTLDDSVNQPPLAADINDDGYPDLIFSTSNGLIYALNRNGIILDMLPAPMNLPPASPLFLSDIDRDGDFEIGYGTNMGISILDYKLPAGLDTPWSVYRGNTGRTGNYSDNVLTSYSYVSPEPLETELKQNYPNPFNVSTTIPFYLEEPANLTIAVYNIRGQLVKEIYSGQAAEGEGEVFWNGEDNNGRPVASGIYFTKMTTDKRNQYRKMLLLK